MRAAQDAKAAKQENAMSFRAAAIAHMPTGDRVVYAAERIRAEAKETLRGTWHNSATFGSKTHAYRDGWMHTRAREYDPYTGARLGFVP